MLLLLGARSEPGPPLQRTIRDQFRVRFHARGCDDKKYGILPSRQPQLESYRLVLARGPYQTCEECLFEARHPSLHVQKSSQHLGCAQSAPQGAVHSLQQDQRQRRFVFLETANNKSKSTY